MSNSITDFLAAILSAKYGEQVRGAIHDAIELCYQDGKAGVNDLEARHLIEQVIGVNEMQDAGIETLAARVEALEQGGEGESAGTTTTTVPTFIVDHGIANFSNVQANKTATMNVTFAKTFTEAPVVAAIKVFRNGPNTFYSLVTAQPVESSITTTGFTLAVGNRYTQAVSPSVLWIAFQPTEIEINTEIIVPSGDGMTEAEVRELLAPISAALNGIKTGYDGTVYSTPGEAVREQINDLHVLIGDEPGTAIQASAVAYNNSNVAAELANVNGRLQEFYALVQFATPSSWELGYINSSNGGNGGSTVTCRNPISNGVYIQKETVIAVSVAEGYTCAVYEYLSNKSTFVKRAVDFTANYLEFTSAGGHYYRFCLKKADGSAIVVDDIPENVITLSYKNRTDSTLTMPDFPADSKTVGDSLVVKSSNVLNPATLSENTYINAYGGESTNSSYATTDYIPVEPGDIVLVTAGDNTQRLIATAVAYNESKVRIAGTATESYSYAVPNNAKFVRICLNQTILTNTTRINIKGSREIYEPYYTGKVSEYVEKNRTDIFRMFSLPVNTLPSYIKNGLIYKPLGVLSKGYVCFTSDDGNTGDATYTIPTFINKNVPCTLALFKGSQILQTQEGINLVKDAVENHGFCVAQHSGSYWLEWNEYQLTKFFDSEKDYFDSIGIDIYGAVNPGMESTDICRIVAGNRFGTFRTDYTAGVPYYDRYIAGPRSNMNSLPSQNLVDLGLDSWKDKCDLTLANHWLMMIHFHGNQIDQSALTLLESVIDYAISIGLEFITQKDIPTLI